MKKPVLVSGIQPTGKLHIGNYLGALKHFVDLQNSGKYECYFFIADYHAITEEISGLRGKIVDLSANYLAAGLDPEKSTIFLQSRVPAHTELAWILNTVTPFGELSRMTQFKEKSDLQTQNINAGLFTYPILMAADILLYNTDFVPVGDDQLQHLELTRAIARRFNSRYGEVFREPKPLMTATPRVRSLDNPEKKMSKSVPTGCVFIDDEPEVIAEKVKRAVTDSGSEIKYDPDKKPAVSNLLGIYSAFAGESISAIEKKFAGKGYADFKKSLGNVLAEFFEPLRTKKEALLKKPNALEKILENGAIRAEKQAAAKLAEAKAKIFS